MDFLNYTFTNPILLTALSFLGGIFAAWLARKFLESTNSMVLTVMFLPAVVCAALLAINGSLGAGIAILGVFGLVRFRSMPGSGTDIVAIFYAMVIGLMMSTGQVVMAIIISILLGIFLIAAVKITNKAPTRYTIHIVVPEDMENINIFETILKKYADSVRMERLKSTNMGSMYELVYSLVPKEGETGKMLDEIRVHNHNLNVALTVARPDNAL